MNDNFKIDSLGNVILPRELNWFVQSCKHESVALETIVMLEKKLHFSKNYFNKIYKYPDGIMIYEIHRIIQFLLVELIKKNLNKENEFRAIERWQFQQILELACFILGDKVPQDFLQDLNELRNKFMHYPTYQNFKDILLSKKHRPFARKILDKKYEYMLSTKSSKKNHQYWKRRKKIMVSIQYVHYLMASCYSGVRR